MEYLYPKYYNKFRCIADKCVHSCCVGWEIDIDDDTYNKYMSVEGLSKNIDSETRSFILTEDERCPFLNKNGLCDIITELGEGYLSQICTDHPRFRNFYPDRIETGLGMCCEEAARIILNEKEKFTLVTQDGKAVKNNIIFDIATDRHKSISERLEALVGLADISLADADTDFYKMLERLDPAWDDILDRKVNGAFSDETALEQLLCYFLFRHTADSVADGIAFAVHATRFISRLATDMEDFTEICRMYSSEIEYSDENKELIINKILGC